MPGLLEDDKKMTSPKLQKIVAALRERPARTDLTWEERRRNMEEMQAALELPGDVVCQPTEANGVPVEWISTPGAEGARCILYLHGGGYTMGSIATHRFLMQAIGRAAAARVLAVDYRLAPEHPFPAALDDATKVSAWLVDRGVDPARTVIAGDSAGGGLTVATALRLRDADRPLPAALVCLSPWTDLALLSPSIAAKRGEDPMVTEEGLRTMAAAYLAGTSLNDPLASPVYAELRGLPPLLIQVGSAELLLDDAARLAERAAAAGVDVAFEPWKEMIHVFQAFPSLPEAHRAIDRIGQFVRRHTA